MFHPSWEEDRVISPGFNFILAFSGPSYGELAGRLGNSPTATFTGYVQPVLKERGKTEHFRASVGASLRVVRCLFPRLLTFTPHELEVIAAHSHA